MHSCMAVNAAFESLQPNALKFVWITLQTCKVEVIKNLGGIDYHINTNMHTVKNTNTKSS